jgi:hypothetical protein
MERSRLLHLRSDNAPQALIACKAKHIIDLVGFTPAHQRLAAEAGIGTQHDADRRPALPDLVYDPFYFFQRARTGVDVGGRSRTPSKCSPQRLYSGK